MTAPVASASRERIEGYDIARCVAIFSMVMVNFNLSMEAATNGPGWLQWLCGLIPCRAAATFVTLAGVGMTLMASRARKSGDLSAQQRVKSTLLKRAVFLFIVGLLFFPIWPPDILHFYGVYIDAVAPGRENVPYFTDPINAPPGSNVIVSVLCE